MHWVLQFFLRNRIFSSLILVTVISGWMLASSSTAQYRIARILMFSVFYPVQYSINTVNSLKLLFEKNKKLNQEMNELKARCEKLHHQKLENSKLRSVLQFDSSSDFDFVHAEVVVREPTPRIGGVIIDAGTRAGIIRYMPVINSEGVVGKVVETFGHFSLIQLLQDPSARTSVMIKRTGEVGLLQSGSARRFFFQCRSYADVVEDDTVVTSGLGGVYPAGQYVGVVTRIEDSSEPVFKNVYVRAFVDFNTLDFLSVIKIQPEWRAHKSEIDSLTEERWLQR